MAVETSAAAAASVPMCDLSYTACYWQALPPCLSLSLSLSLSIFRSLLHVLSDLFSYSEENVYLLCQQLSRHRIAAHDASDLFVVFISNANRQVPIWCQKAGSPQEDGMVIWDYHVICIQMKKDTEALVWDLDTTLEFPETFAKYIARAFHPWLDLSPTYQRLYRVVAAPLFLKFFASDRRHMRTADGLWKRPPPSYDCICGGDGVTHNLEDYISMSEETVLLNGSSTEKTLSQDRWGVVLGEASLQMFFS